MAQWETSGLGGKMALGGISNAFESVIRQKLNGEDVNWWTVAQDASIGAATGGLFHYGGKAIKGASSYALSENAKFAKMAFKNMQNGPKTVVLGSNLGNVDDALKRFGKEFKDVKNTSKLEPKRMNNAIDVPEFN